MPRTFISKEQTFLPENLAAATEVNTILTEEFDKAFAGATVCKITLANARRELMKR